MTPTQKAAWDQAVTKMLAQPRDKRTPILKAAWETYAADTPSLRGVDVGMDCGAFVRRLLDRVAELEAGHTQMAPPQSRHGVSSGNV